MSKKIYRIVVVTLLLLSGSYFAKANTYTAVRTGNWTTPSTWGQLLNVPTASDIVFIPTGFTVTVTTTTAAASAVTITGTGEVSISSGDKLTIGGALSNAGTVIMNSTSSLLVGGSLTNTNTLFDGPGTLSVTGTVTNSGTLTVTTGTFTATGTVTNSGTLSGGTGSTLLGASLTNSRLMTVSAGGKLTFDGAANSTITSSGGTYTITGTVVLNMGAAATALDVLDPNFISGINSGGKYYFTFTRGTFRMDNTGTLNNAYNSGSATALTIPYGVVLESDNGTMNLATKGTSNNVLLSGQLFMNGGTVNVQTGQTASQDFRYTVNGGTPQLYISSGTLNIGSGFNPKGGSDYIDFHMTGGTMAITTLYSSNFPTFQLQDVAGGKTFMSGGLILLDQPGNGPYNDLDMGGSAISPYSVTGGTVQFGGTGFPYNSTANFWITPYATTNYPNLVDDALNSASVLAETAGAVNALSLYISTGTTFDASNISTLNITGSNGVYAFDDEGTFTTGNNTVEFSGGVAQAIKSASVSPLSFYNMQVANTGGNVILDVPTKVTKLLTFTSGQLDASADPLTIPSGGSITGYNSSRYVITGDGVTNTGYLAMQGLTKNATTTLPIGTSSYYLPATVNPGNFTNSAYTAYVYPGVTTNAQSNGTSLPSATLYNFADITWNIAQTAGSNTTTALGLNWASSGTTMEGGGFQTFGTAIGITQYSGGSWGAVTTGSGSVASETATGTFSGMSQFSVTGTTAIILPLVLGNFNAIPQGRTSLLTWAAFPDGQTGSFTVQRSPDGSNWTDLGVVQADVIATMETNYSFTDVSPVAGQNDYRLLIQNEDGSTSYSMVKVVEFSTTASLTIYPNPVNSALTIGIGNSNKTLSIRLVNTAGTVLQSKIAETGVATVIMNTGTYPTGVYFVEILDGGQLLQTTAVMVAH